MALDSLSDDGRRWEDRDPFAKHDYASTMTALRSAIQARLEGMQTADRATIVGRIIKILRPLAPILFQERLSQERIGNTLAYFSAAEEHGAATAHQMPWEGHERSVAEFRAMRSYLRMSEYDLRTYVRKVDTDIQQKGSLEQALGAWEKDTMSALDEPEWEE